MNMRNKYIIGISAGAIGLVLAAGGTAFAANIQRSRPTAIGTVASINGNAITLTGKNSTTYSVDATNATVTKFTPGISGTKGTSATITVAQIQVGDNLVVQGTASGNSVTATKITDGTMGGRFSGKRTNFPMPAVIGTVSAISSNTITVAGKNGTVYSVDATNATVTKFTAGAAGSKPTRATISISGIAVGDNVIVTGTVSGKSITATKIMDGTFPTGGFGNKTTKPAAMGTVSSVSGNTITLTGKNSAVTTVDASNATITKFTPGTAGAKGTSATITISQIQVGDNLVVQGTTTGSSVVATKIMDGKFMGRGFGHKPAQQ